MDKEEFRKLEKGDIVKLSKLDALMPAMNTSMLPASEMYLKITGINNNEDYCRDAYIMGEGYPVTSSRVFSWCWYPHMIDHKLTLEEIVALDKEYANNQTIDGKKIVKCDLCGEMTFGEPYTIDGKTLCSSCKEAHVEICCVCGKEHYHENWGDRIFNRVSDYKYACNECLEKLKEEGNKLFYCNGHDRYELIEDTNIMTAPNGDEYCEDSFWEVFTTCDECGETIYRDDSYYDDDDGNCYCEYCWDDRCTKDIYTKVHSYHSPVKLKWGTVKDGQIVYSDNNSNFKGYGIELEVNPAPDSDYTNRDYVVEELSNISNNAFFYQEDGSLDDDGFEIISHPHTKEALDLLPLEEMCKYLIKEGYESHNAGCCGLHVHISRNLFGDTTEEQDDKILKMVQFYHTFWEDVVKFSRRKNFTYCGKLPVHDDEELKMYVKNKRGDHSVAINLGDDRSDTVEVRIMRGTLNAKTLRATLDFVAHIAERATTIADEDIGDTSKWLEGISDRCIEYMKSRECFGYTIDTMGEV